MRNIILSFLLLSCAVVHAQTNKPLPPDAVPFSGQIWISPSDSTLWTGSFGEYTQVATRHKLDSLMGLGYTKAQVDSAISAGSALQDLQSVLTVGNTTTTPIVFGESPNSGSRVSLEQHENGVFSIQRYFETGSNPLFHFNPDRSIGMSTGASSLYLGENLGFNSSIGGLQISNNNLNLYSTSPFVFNSPNVNINANSQLNVTNSSDITTSDTGISVSAGPANVNLNGNGISMSSMGANLNLNTNGLNLNSYGAAFEITPGSRVDLKNSSTVILDNGSNISTTGANIDINSGASNITTNSENQRYRINSGNTFIEANQISSIGSSFRAYSSPTTSMTGYGTSDISINSQHGMSIITTPSTNNPYRELNVGNGRIFGQSNTLSNDMSSFDFGVNSFNISGHSSSITGNPLRLELSTNGLAYSAPGKPNIITLPVDTGLIGQVLTQATDGNVVWADASGGGNQDLQSVLETGSTASIPDSILTINASNFKTYGNLNLGYGSSFTIQATPINIDPSQIDVGSLLSVNPGGSKLGNSSGPHIDINPTSFIVQGINSTNNYKLPPTRGTVGQTLIQGEDGVVNWTDAGSTPDLSNYVTKVGDNIINGPVVFTNSTASNTVSINDWAIQLDDGIGSSSYEAGFIGLTDGSNTAEYRTNSIQLAENTGAYANLGTDGLSVSSGDFNIGTSSYLNNSINFNKPSNNTNLTLNFPDIGATNSQVLPISVNGNFADVNGNINTGIIYGGTLDAESMWVNLTDEAKTMLGTTEDYIQLTNDTAPVTGYEANKNIYYKNNVLYSTSYGTIAEGDLFLSTGVDWNIITGKSGVVGINGSGTINATNLSDDRFYSLSINNNSITNAHLQPIPANSINLNNSSVPTNPGNLELPNNTLLGRGSTGNISPITLGSGLTMSGTTLSSTISSPLEAINEGSGIGYVVGSRNPANYGNVGLAAWDFSFSNSASTTKGATGNYSIAFGANSTASQPYSMSFGNGAIASRAFSQAFGNNSTASGYSSIAFGDESTASGDRSISFGYGSVASGTWSSSFGTSSIASATNSVAFGQGSIASAANSVAFGQGSIANNDGSFTIGRYSTGGVAEAEWVNGSPIFKVGNGQSAFNRSNAYVLNNDGTSTQYGVASYGGDYPLTHDLNLVTKKYADRRNIIIDNTITSTFRGYLQNKFPDAVVGDRYFSEAIQSVCEYIGDGDWLITQAILASDPI